MGSSSVVDVGKVDELGELSHPPQGATPTPRQDSRDQMGIARPPHQVRPQGNGSQAIIIGPQNQSLGHGLGRRIGRLIVTGIGDRLVHTFHVLTLENNAGRTGVDQLRHTALAAGFNDPSGSLHIGLVKPFVVAPDARLGRHMKDHITTLASPFYLIPAGEISPLDLHTQPLQLRIITAGETGDLSPLGDQLAHNSSPPESPHPP